MVKDRSGHPGVPSNIKLIKGTLRRGRDRRRDAQKPRVEPVMPDAPEFLSAEAKVEWDRVAQELAKLRILTRLDCAVLALYAETWADFVSAAQSYAAAIDPSEKAAWCKIKTSSGDALLKLSKSLGLTPSSRGSRPVPVERERLSPRWRSFNDSDGA